MWGNIVATASLGFVIIGAAFYVGGELSKLRTEVAGLKEGRNSQTEYCRDHCPVMADYKNEVSAARKLGLPKLDPTDHGAT